MTSACGPPPQLQGEDDAIQKAIVLAREHAASKGIVKSVIRHIDLTTLAGDDTAERVFELVDKADADITCGAVCVYPLRVADAKKRLNDLGVKLPIASVAAGFPSGQFHLRSRLLEIELAVADGATEIDVVICRPLALAEQWQELGNELRQMKEKCGPAHLKVILATGELKSPEQIYKASWVAMNSGADFIKTSTGKEKVNATLPVAYVMLKAISDFKKETGRNVGFKPAGGIRTLQEALEFRALVEVVLGAEWLTPALFRIGASSLLDDVVKAVE